MTEMAEISNSRKIFNGISTQTLVTVALGVVELVSFSIMSRLLTKEDFGYYAAITGIVAVFSCFADTGIGSAVVQRKDITKRYVNNAFTISLIVGCIVAFALFASSSAVAGTVADRSMEGPLMLMSVTLLLNCLTSVNISIMYRKLEFLKVGLVNFVSLLLTSATAIFLAWKGYGYHAIIAKAVMSSVLNLLLSSFFAKTRYHLAFDMETFKQIFGFSGWLMASGLFRNLAHNVDKLVMPRLLSVASLGAYNRPQGFIGQISMTFNGIFDTVLFPVLSGIQDDKEKMGRAFRKSLFFMNVFAMLLTLGFVINSELLIRVFFGEQWMELVNVVIVLSLTLLFNIDGRLADCFLRSLGLTKQQFFFRVLETVVTLLGVIFGSRWDIMGVAVSVALTNMLLKLLKISYVVVKVGIPVTSAMKEITKSWRFAVVVVPICLIAYVFAPTSMAGNIVLLAVFAVTCAVIFLLFPNVVGVEYEQAYWEFVDNKKIRKKNI